MLYEEIKVQVFKCSFFKSNKTVVYVIQYRLVTVVCPFISYKRKQGLEDYTVRSHVIMYMRRIMILTR